MPRKGSVQVGRRTVFISHSHKDARAASLLSAVLKKKGIDVWDASIAADKDRNFENSLRAALENSCAFICLVSRNTSTSSAWELGAALALMKRIIIVALGEVPDIAIRERICKRYQVIKIRSTDNSEIERAASEVDLRINTMNKEELITRVAAEVSLKRAQIEPIIDSLLKNIEKALTNGADVSLSGFGTFTVGDRKARLGKIRETQENIVTPSLKIPEFDPAHDLDLRDSEMKMELIEPVQE